MSTSLIIREMKIKSQEDDTTHLSEWLPSKRQQITSVSEDMEKRELWCTVDDIVNSIAPTIENSIEAPQKVKYRTTIWCSNPTFEFMFGKKKWNHCLEGYLHLHVHCSIICDSKDMEITKMYIYDEKDKEMWKYMCVCVCLHAMEYYSAIKRKSFWTTWFDLESVDLGEINLHRKTSTLCFHLEAQSNNRNSYN